MFTLHIEDSEIAESDNYDDLLDTLEKVSYFDKDGKVFYMKIDGEVLNSTGYSRDQIMQLLSATRSRNLEKTYY